jgi:hypothetical protein
MFGIEVKKVASDIVIKFQLTKVVIPIADIINVTLDDTYADKEKDAIRIGLPYGTTDRIAIETKTSNYLLFSTNYSYIINTINSAIRAN